MIICLSAIKIQEHSLTGWTHIIQIYIKIRSHPRIKTKIFSAELCDCFQSNQLINLSISENVAKAIYATVMYLFSASKSFHNSFSFSSTKETEEIQEIIYITVNLSFKKIKRCTFSHPGHATYNLLMLHNCLRVFDVPYWRSKALHSTVYTNIY